MRLSKLASVTLIAIGCAQQHEYDYGDEPNGDEPEGGEGGGKAIAGSTGKGGSIASGGKTSTGGKTSAGTGGSDEEGGEAAGGEMGSGGTGGAGGKSTGGSTTGGTGGKAGSGGTGGKAGSGGTGGTASCTTSPSGPIQGVTGRYESEIDNNGAGIGGRLMIVNAGPSTLNLADLKLRYYLTNEVQATINRSINWAYIQPNPGTQGSATPIEGMTSFEVVPLACPAADTYLEFTFAANAGNVAPGFHMRLSFTANNGASENFDQSDDYSFDANHSWDNDYTKIVILQNNGNRVWGTEP